MRLAEIAAMLQSIGRTDDVHAQRIPSHETLEKRLIHAREVLGNLGECVLRRRTEVHGNIVSRPIQIEEHSTAFTLRLYGRKIDCERSGTNSALGTEERVDPSQFAFHCAGAFGRSLKTYNRLLELGTLEWLDQEFVGARSHGCDHGLTVRMIMRHDHI